MKIKDLFPPLIIDYIRKNQKVVKYKTYEEALSQCSANAYQNEELCNMIADKTLIYIESLQKPYCFNPTTVYLAFALNFFSNSTSRREIKVIDFGGACGTHYFEVRNILPPTISLKWFVVETEQMIQSAMSRGLGKGELTFVTQIEDVNEPIDFVYSSSALQYVPSPYSFLKKLIGVGARMVLFNRMMFNKNNYDIITVQKSLLSSNGPGKLPSGYKDRPIMYPHTAMAIEQLNTSMLDNGYECLSEFDESSGMFFLGKEEILGKGLFFIKK
jgi:putative methyltransferase (TIGR04325 family)